MPVIPIDVLKWKRSSRDIRSTRKEGKLHCGDFLLLWELRGPEAESSSASVGVVAGRGFKSAVARNRAKRRVRGCIMDKRRLLRAGHTYLVECKPGADIIEYHILVNDLERVLSKAES